MALFSGKIVDVKFFDRQNTIIEVLYKDNDQEISYALEVDWTSQDFQDLLDEWSLEDIEQNTYKKHEQIEKLREENKKKEEEKLRQKIDIEKVEVPVYIKEEKLVPYAVPIKETQYVEVEVLKEVEVPTAFDFHKFFEQRYDPNLVFHIKADFFRMRGMASLPKSKINKIKKSKDALELLYLMKLALQ